MARALKLLLAFLMMTWAPAAHADIQLSFHSFNGSVFFGRYPHTFIVLEGSLEDGTPIRENYGFTAKRVTPAVLTGPVEHEVYTEEQKWIDKTNRHFTVTIDDAKYWAIRREVARWRDAPGKYYDLGKRNCIHFVGSIARMVGASVDFPSSLLRKPREWLNRVVARNPKLEGKTF